MQYNSGYETAMSWIKSHDVSQIMAAILSTLAGVLLLLHGTMTIRNSSTDKIYSTWLACPVGNQSKRSWEVFNLYYACIWISCFAVIIYFEIYKELGRVGYMIVCGGLSVPILLSPIFFPSEWDSKLPLLNRFGVRANLWMAIYSFIGNYWYTHYFYCVLRATYSMPGWRLNDVPIQLYFATFFYFCFYHTLSNMAIRKVVTTYRDDIYRSAFVCTLVFVLAYFTAFMETLTISAYPDYSFEDRYLAYSLGSAFYGIYFIVSFPMFYRFDEWPKLHGTISLFETCVNSAGCSMIILTILDVVRLILGVRLTIP